MTQITTPMVVYWHTNQVAVSLESPLSLEAGPVEIIKTLNLQGIQNLLNTEDLQLQSFQDADIPHPVSTDAHTQSSSMTATAKGSTNAATTDDLNSTVGKYLFRSPRAENKQGTSAMCFFRIARVSMPPAADKMAEGMQASSMGSNMKDAAMGWSYEQDDTIATVNLINRNLDALRNAGVPVIAAAPNWLNGGTPPYGCGTHGCPVSPPVPVTVDGVDASCSGNWKLEFTQLSGALQTASGNGVTVLVLDTLPTQAQIAGAAAADPNNALLQDVNANVTINYVKLPDVDDTANPELTATGKDIYGRLVGFPMTDHGTFIAGQIRDLAQQAQIECIRVLNDAGVGTTAILTRALEDIQKRLEGNPPAGEAPLSLPLVVNLSLVTTPPDEILSSDPTVSQLDKDKVYLLRDTLHTVMSSLAQKGVVFVASSGNDSDPRPDASMTMGGGMGGGMGGMTMPPARFEARFPAAFAYDHTYPSDSGPQTLSRIPGVIPVGALKSPVNGIDQAASYSNYSGSDGINIYGGELLTPIPDPEDDPVPASFVTQAKRPIDALRGIYTDTKFPYLSVDDELNPVPPSPHPLREYPEYSNPDPTPPHSMAQRITWAYWSGTSFATPMISALAARILEGDSSTVGDAMRNELESVSQVESIWDRLPGGVADTNGYVVGVQQMCDSGGIG